MFQFTGPSGACEQNRVKLEDFFLQTANCVHANLKLQPVFVPQMVSKGVSFHSATFCAQQLFLWPLSGACQVSSPNYNSELIFLLSGWYRIQLIDLAISGNALLGSELTVAMLRFSGS